MKFQETLDNTLLEKIGDAKIRQFKYRPNRVGEFFDNEGHHIRAGYYGPTPGRGTNNPILLEFGIWDRSNKKKYSTNEPLLTGIDITFLKAKDIIKIGGPLDEYGIPTGDYLREIMKTPGGKSKYNKFISVMDEAYGPGYSEKVLHKNPPIDVTGKGTTVPHGSWRTYIVKLASRDDIQKISPEDFVELAAKLKLSNIPGSMVYSDILKNIDKRKHARDETDVKPDDQDLPAPKTDFDTIPEPEIGPEEVETPEEPNLSFDDKPDIEKEEPPEIPTPIKKAKEKPSEVQEKPSKKKEPRLDVETQRDIKKKKIENEIEDIEISDTIEDLLSSEEEEKEDFDISKTIEDVLKKSKEDVEDSQISKTIDDVLSGDDDDIEFYESRYRLPKRLILNEE